MLVPEQAHDAGDKLEGVSESHHKKTLDQHDDTADGLNDRFDEKAEEYECECDFDEDDHDLFEWVLDV